MKQLWFKGFSYKGHPQKLLEQISKQVQQHNLSQWVPSLRIERGATPRKLFYFFLAIESSELGQVPPEVQMNLLGEPSCKNIFFKSPVPGSKGFRYDEIKTMTGTDYDIHEYTSSLVYQLDPPLLDDDPFSMPDYPPSSTLTKASSQPYEHLLYWLSTLGNGHWQSFQKICESLLLSEPKRILRRLKLLGHLETSADGKQWSISPSALVKVFSSTEDHQEFVWCGQRVPNLLERLKQHVEVKEIEQVNAPRCIRFRTTSADQLPVALLQSSIVDAGEASYRLATILSDLSTWQQTLKELPGIIPSRYHWQCFDGTKFIECLSPDQTGLYQFSPRETKVRCLPRAVFYDQTQQRYLTGDWYGLRYLALQHHHSSGIIANYEPATARLAIPWSHRFPELYERALVLASGQLPTRQDQWLIYAQIQSTLARLLLNKLQLSCEGLSNYV
ncbi:MAG: hypothetical protein BWK78_00850 [Thiotrichaceae bacterium IS1]|nr:MAG: hypothetical protein BWK78_00850 [Thiotrichaceae bacterium IS1]